MRTIRLAIQYDGTDYSGWQSQKNGRTVQEAIEKALHRITGENIPLCGSGRTDSGVHAYGQIAHFKTRSGIPVNGFKMALASYLPDDIVVIRVEDAEASFHARYDAKEKWYRYTICNSNFVDPLVRRYTGKCPFPLDIKKMRLGAKPLLGKHDFRAFKTVDTGDEERKTVRTIKKLSIKKRGEIITIDMIADGFLYNMVRTIAGTLMEIGRGKMKAQEMKNIIEKRDRRLSGPTAPAEGLCLMEVKY